MALVDLGPLEQELASMRRQLAETNALLRAVVRMTGLSAGLMEGEIPHVISEALAEVGPA